MATRTLSDVELRAAALAAIENAGGLLADAKLLMDHARYPRVVSLAIIGQEELGKSILFTLAALDVVEGLRNALLQHGAKNPSADHAAKQVSTEFAGIIAWRTDEYEGILADEASAGAAFNSSHWYSHFISGCAEEVRAQLKDSKRAKRYQQGIKEMLNGIPAFRKRLPPSRTPEEQKWAGLYVDIHEARLSVPGQIAEGDAQLSIISFEADLNTVCKLRHLLSDEELWMNLKNQMQNGVQ